MNKRDKDNLAFIMYADIQTIEKWFDGLSTDDLVYAFELLQMAQTELELQRLEVLDQVEDTDEADYAILEILSKFDNK